MKLLLDTHIWLWGHLDPDKLTKRVAKALTDRRNELWLSPISLWEFLLLVERGRIVVDLSTDEWIDRAMHCTPLHEAMLNHDVAKLSRSLQVPHDDPADRFLAATAAAYELVLVTSDERLLDGKGYKTFANR